MTLISCSDTIVTEHATFTIPPGFSKQKVTKESKDLLKLKLNEEMYIIVRDDLDDLLAKNNIEGYDAMKMAHNIKFKLLKTKYKGYNETALQSYELNGRQVFEQSFANNENKGNMYCKYFLTEVNNHFLEIIITGKSNLKTEQTSVCEDFLKMIE